MSIAQFVLPVFKGVKESLKTACEGKANVNKAFIDTVLLQQLAPIILNKVRYAKKCFRNVFYSLFAAKRHFSVLLTFFHFSLSFLSVHP